MSRISQAKERAAAAREKARAAFEERKLGPRRSDEIDQDKERSKRNSDDVLSDMTLRYGDIVSTTRGLFRFIGRGETEPSAGDFAPYSPDRGQTRTGP